MHPKNFSHECGKIANLNKLAEYLKKRDTNSAAHLIIRIFINLFIVVFNKSGKILIYHRNDILFRNLNSSSIG